MKDQMIIGDKSVSMMSEEQALQFAAAAWCGKDTRHKVMDPELAFEFARILQKEVNIRAKRLKLMEDAAVVYRTTRDTPLKLMEDAPVVYRMTRGTPLRFPPEAIVHMEIGEDRKSFNPGVANGNEATDR